MEFAVLGWPPDGPRLRLDHRRFAYAGKFVMTATGKAVALADGTDPEAVAAVADDPEALADVVLGAVAFSPDRTDDATLWLRYVTVRADRRGTGVGSPLAAFVVDRARDRGFDRARIAVNNPYAYHALAKAGFANTGERTGLAELVMECPTAAPTERDPERYRAGLSAFTERDLTDDERAFVAAKREAGPPTRLARGE